MLIVHLYHDAWADKRYSHSIYLPYTLAQRFIPTLKKQVGCFNHRVVALVAIMSGLCEVSFGIRDLIAQGNQ